MPWPFLADCVRCAVAALFLLIPHVLHAQDEPSYEIIKSGACAVKWCTDIALLGAKEKIRVYSSTSIRIEVKDIPADTCACERVTVGNFKNDQVSLYIVLPGGVRLHPVYVGRKDNPQSVAFETTYEKFEREREQFEEVPDFVWRGIQFDQFRVFRTKRIYGNASRRYVFVSNVKDDISLGANAPVAFDTPLARRLVLDAPEGGDDLTVSSNVRLPNGFYLFPIFYPGLIPPNDWIPMLSRSVGIVRARFIQ